MHRKDNHTWLTSFGIFLANYGKAREESNHKRGNSLGSLLKLLLTLAGFACLTLAGFTLSMIVGLVVAGVSCFLLAWLYGSNESETATVH